MKFFGPFMDIGSSRLSFALGPGRGRALEQGAYADERASDEMQRGRFHELIIDQWFIQPPLQF
jgi:hypothetical protein